MSADFGYVGRCPECLGVVFVSAHEPENARRNAPHMAAMMFTGMVVDRLSIEDIRKLSLGHSENCSRREDERSDGILDIEVAYQSCTEIRGLGETRPRMEWSDEAYVGCVGLVQDWAREAVDGDCLVLYARRRR